MNNIKVAFLLMKGFDGCGVSRFAIEHQNEMTRLGNICDIYANGDSHYIRQNSHTDANVIYYDDFCSLDFSSYDIVILNSYPKEFDSRQLEHYKNIRGIKVAMMHEILMQNVNRISHVWDWIDASDIVSSFSTEMDFVKSLFNRNKDANYFSFKMPMNTSYMSSLYDNSINNDRDNSLVYFGRWTTMKDPSRLFSYRELDTSIKYRMIGIERSVGASFDIFSNELCACPMKISKRDSGKLVHETFISNSSQYFDYDMSDDRVWVFPPIERTAALEILSKSMFGCSFYSLNNNRINNLGNRMEFTQIEMSCVCLPVFDIDWGKNTIDRETGLSFYELGNNAIYSDTNNLKDSLEEMKYLVQHKEEYENRRKNIFDLVCRNYNEDNIISFYDNILNRNFEKIHSKNKSLFDIYKSF